MRKISLRYLGSFLKILIKRFTIIEKVILVFLVLVLILNLTGFFGRFLENDHGIIPEKGGVLVEGVAGQPRLINPLLARSDVDKTLSSLLFSGLVSYNKQREIIADLAERWETSEDKKVYKFFLRQDIKWHDGTLFNADDVIYTVAVLQNPDYKESRKSSWEGITIEKNDNHTVTFVLPRSYPAFLDNLTIGLVPRHIWDPITVSDFPMSSYNINAIGTGNYKVDNIIKGKNGDIASIKMIANPFLGEREPYIQNLEMKFYNTKENLFRGFRMKEFSSFGMYSSDGKEIASRTRGYNNYKVNLPQYIALFINKKNNPALGEIVVRQAMSYALDKDKINDAGTFGSGVAIDSPILPGYLGYNPETKKYNYDRRAATALLAQAGWLDQNNDGIKEKGEQKLEFNLVTINDDRLVRVAEKISEQWADIGIKVKVNSVDSAILDREYLQTRSYDILLFGESIGNDPDPYPYWHSSQVDYPGLNSAGFANGEVDQLLEEARQTTDTNIKIKNYLKFQEIIAEEIPAIFLYQPVYIYKVYDRVRGIDLGGITNTWDRFSGINEWFVRFSRE